MKTEIAYNRSRFTRVIQTGESRFEVQAFTIRGAVAKWRKLYAVYDREKAIRLLESYATHS